MRNISQKVKVKNQNRGIISKNILEVYWRKIISTNQAGFTFIELILYVAIVSVVLTSLTLFAMSVIQTNTKSGFQQEVNGSARLISERIKYEIRNSTGINSVSATSISLINSNASFNPTIIDMVGGKVRIKQGASAAVDLNSTETFVSSFSFTNYTSSGNQTEHIGYVFTITDNLTSARQEYQITPLTIRGSAEVRSI